MRQDRRTFLATAAGALAVATAGCETGNSRSISPSYRPDPGDWPRPQYGFQNRRYSPHADPPRTEPVRRWHAPTEGTVTSVVVAAGTVYALGKREGIDHQIHAFALEDGSERWSRALQDSVTGVHYLDGRLYAPGGSLHAFDATNGREQFATDVPDGIGIDVVECEGTIFVGTDGGTLLGLNADDGERRWRLDGPSNVFLGVYDGRVVVLTNRGVELADANGASGRGHDDPPEVQERWSANLENTDLLVFPPAITDGVLCRGGATQFTEGDAELAAASLDDQAGLWTREFAPRVESPAVIDGRAYTVARSRGTTSTTPTSVYALDVATGGTIWEQSIDQHLVNPPVLADRCVLVAGGSLGSPGNLVALDPGTGERLWAYPLSGGAFTHEVALSGDRIVVGDAEGVHVLGD